MKRSEFLKRLGLGLGAAVAAPALLRGEEKVNEYHEAEPVCKDSIGKVKKLIFPKEPTYSSTAMSAFLITDNDEMLGPYELKR